MCRQIRIRTIGNSLKIQIIILVFIVLFFLWYGAGTAISCLYGGGIAIVNALLQERCLVNSVKWDRLDVTVNLRKAYRCFVRRWVATIIMFAVGFAVLKLFPLPLITSCIAIQLALSFWNRNGL